MALALCNPLTSNKVYITSSRAFTAYEENVPISAEKEHKQRTNLDEYKLKLQPVKGKV